MTPPASVIVRARDEARTIEQTFQALRRQTCEVEVIVVDSGSTDGTLEIAQRYCDRLVAIPQSEFTYGRALNVGARAASAPIHFALSAHCAPEQDDWVERSLAYYPRPEVAATNGVGWLDGRRWHEPFFQTAADGERPHGFSNHASSWRASVWEENPFDEQIAAAEDLEWAWRVLAQGWEIAFDPALRVDASHAWTTASELYRRERRCAQALAGLPGAPPYRARDVARDWWSEMPDDRHSPFAHRFLNHRRLAGLAGRYLGSRAADSSRPSSAAPAAPASE